MRGQPHLRELALGQRVRTIALPAERGSIFDRNGVDLAVSVPQTTISADPRVIDDPVAYAAKLAPIVLVDPATLEERLSDPDSAFAYVARKVDDATVAKAKDSTFPASSTRPSRSASTPRVRSPASVLGFVGTDNNGLGGLETQYESPLRGAPGEVRAERDLQGNEIPGTNRLVRPAQRGADLVLTIDQSIQWNTEQVSPGRSKPPTPRAAPQSSPTCARATCSRW